eukprot:m.60031 g.60031  ORF g.60031 m.60031 type:complete len:251 (+) comp6999_c0_seq2:183-935(+)
MAPSVPTEWLAAKTMCSGWRWILRACSNNTKLSLARWANCVTKTSSCCADWRSVGLMSFPSSESSRLVSPVRVESSDSRPRNGHGMATNQALSLLKHTALCSLQMSMAMNMRIQALEQTALAARNASSRESNIAVLLNDISSWRQGVRSQLLHMERDIMGLHSTITRQQQDIDSLVAMVRSALAQVAIHGQRAAHGPAPSAAGPARRRTHRTQVPTETPNNSTLSHVPSDLSSAIDDSQNLSSLRDDSIL